MPNENPILPDLQGAADLISHVEQRTYLQKMAAEGYPAKTQAQAEQLISLGFKVAALTQDAVHAEDDFYSRASADLDPLLKQAGLELPNDDVYAQAADLLRDPDVYKSAAVLAVHNWEVAESA